MSRIDTFGDDGFTLMEVMVAMLILAISFTLVLQLFSGSLRSGHLSERYLVAVYHARAKMEEALLREKIEPGIREGEVGDGYTWVTTVKYFGKEVEENSDEDLVLYQCTVKVSWPHGKHQKSLTIQSLRIGSMVEEEVNDVR